jgi:hypothetical protein
MSVGPPDPGAPVIGHAEVETVYWGQDWTSPSGPLPYLQPGQTYSSYGRSSSSFSKGDNQRTIQETDNFFTNITNSPYMDLLNQYGAYRGLFEGHDIAPSSTSPPASGTTVFDSQIQAMLKGEIASGRVPSPSDANQLYFVLTPPDVVINDGQTSSPSFGGYHSYFKDDALGVMVHYAVIVFPIGPSTDYAFPLIGYNASHELAEAVTDPEGNAWFDHTIGTNGGEIGDLGLSLEYALNGYNVTGVWSNKDNGVASAQGNATTMAQGGWVSAITTLTDVWGYPYIFGIDSNHGVVYKKQDSSGNWGNWIAIGAPSHSIIVGSGGRIAHSLSVPLWYGARSISVINDGGVFRVFAIGMDNGVYTFAQGDNSWTGLGGQAQQVVAGHRADGRLEVFAIGLKDNVVYSDVRTGTGSGGWAGTSWTPLTPYASPTQTMQAKTIAVDSATGEEEVFAIGLDGAVHTIGESLLGSLRTGFFWSWGNWVTLKPLLFGAAQSLAVETTADGREEVFAIDKNNYVESIRQAAPGDGSWSMSDWNDLGGRQQAKSLSVGRSPGGREEVFAIDLANNVVSIAQAAANDGWTDSQWFSMGIRASQVAVVLNHALSFGVASAGYDKLTVAAITGSNSVVTSQQTAPETGWN